jgi:hypothetical protein
MSDPVSTSVDLGSVALQEEAFADDLLTFGGAATYPAGTILGRRRVAAAITPSAVTGTGNGTVTAASVQTGDYVPKSGNYTLKCVVAATNGGTFVLLDPDGEQVAGSLVLTAGSGGANAFKAGGIAFTINDGSTDFAVGDTFTLPVTAGGKLEAYSKTGTGGTQIPVAVLTYDVVAAGAGDIKVRALIKGILKKKRLIINADGDDSNIDFLVRDQLRRSGLTAVDSTQTSS